VWLGEKRQGEAQQMKIARREGAMGGTIPLLGFVLTGLLGTSLLLAAVPAHAAKTFTVNSNLDSADPSGGVCDALATWGEQCTLRAAVQEANHPTNLGADRIGFNIGGGIGVKTGSPRSELPADNRAAAINGYTQPGAAGNTDAGPGKTRARPLAELEGTNVAQLPVGGLDVRAANVVVRGSLSTASHSTAATFARTPMVSSPRAPRSRATL
jgi:CSLREA domain-containing protein